MNADLNTPEALAIVFDLMAWSRNQKIWTEMALTELHHLVRIIHHTFSCFEPEDEEIPVGVLKLLAKRDEARHAKDFRLSDELRKKIQSLGYEVRDTPEGQKVRRAR
jgi:cysteinyl-tRNA synthetase